MKQSLNSKTVPKSIVASVTGSRFVPMLMSTPMVTAILNGTKTETRRIIKPQLPIYSEKFPEIVPDWKMEFHDIIERFARLKHTYEFVTKSTGDKNIKSIILDIPCKIVVNDIIWVRETFRPIEQDNGKPRYEYKATENINLLDKWKPSLFMPKYACRIFLKCVSVHVERLHEIDEESAIKEGVKVNHGGFELYTKEEMFKNNRNYAKTAIESYKSLWKKINGKESWDENTFVWVYKFEVVERPNDFL